MFSISYYYEHTNSHTHSHPPGILLLGNIKFEDIHNSDDEYHVRISNLDVVKKAAKMLGLKQNVLHEMLRKRVIPAIVEGEDNIHKPYETSLEAVAALDALTKSIYARMFKFVVHSVNKTLAPDDDGHSSHDNFIGILDIFGFEIFVENSFEQLLINYANEMLQNLFNEHVFKNEAKIYKEEGISIEHIEFPDNQPCVELIDGDYRHCKFTGILGQLDELTLRPVTKGRKPPSDRDFGKGLRKVFYDKKGLSKRGKEAKKRFRVVKKLNKFKGKHFWVNHFAGEVDYVTDGFIGKNRDKVFPHLLTMMEYAKSEFVQELFLTNWDTGKKRDPPDDNDDDGDKDKKKKKKKKKKRKKKSSGGKTIGLKFKTALQSLSKTLSKTQPHYIRCVKPNDHKYNCDQGWKAFEGVKVKEQLLRAGVMETVKIRQSGFPVRFEYDRAYEKYEKMNLHNLVPSATRKKIRDAETLREKCILILSSIEDANGKWAEGKTKLFAKETLHQSIMTWRRKHCADEVQDWYRYYDCQHRLHNFHCSMVYLQISWRNILIARKYESMLHDIQISQRVLQSIVAARTLRNLRKQRLAIQYAQRWYRFHRARSMWNELWDRASNQKAVETLTRVQKMKKTRLAMIKFCRKVNERLRAHRVEKCTSMVWRIVMAKRFGKALKLRQIKHDHNMMAMTAGAFAYMWLHRSMAVFKLQKQKLAVKTLASQFLVHKTRTWYEAMRLAAVECQRYIRGTLARRRYKKRKVAHRRIRLWACVTQIRIRYLKKRRLIIYVQKQFRRNVYRKWFRLTKNAARKLQFFWRFRNLMRQKSIWLSKMERACNDGDAKTVKELLFLPGPYRVLKLFPNLINIQDSIYGSTLAHSAARGGNIEILRVLLSHGMNLNVVDGIGQTPLHYSCTAGDENFEFTQCLLTHVVDPAEALRVMNRYDETPLDKLREANGPYGLTEKLMLRYGAVASVSKRGSYGLRRRSALLRETDAIRKKREEETTKRQEVEAQKRLQNDAMYSLMMLNPDIVDPVSKAIRQDKQDRATKKLQRVTKLWLIGKRLKRRAEIGVLSEFDLETSIDVAQALHKTKESADKRRTDERREDERKKEMNWRLKQMRSRLYMWTAGRRVNESALPSSPSTPPSIPTPSASSRVKRTRRRRIESTDEKRNNGDNSKELEEARKRLEDAERSSREEHESLVRARTRIHSLENKLSQATSSEAASLAEKELEDAKQKLEIAEQTSRVEHEALLEAQKRIEDLERKVSEAKLVSSDAETTKLALTDAQKRIRELELEDKKAREETQRRIQELQKQIEISSSEKKEEEETDPLPPADPTVAALYAVHSPFTFKSRRTESMIKDDASEVSNQDESFIAPGLEGDLDPRRYRKTLLMHVKHIYSWLNSEPKNRGWYYIDNSSKRRGPFATSAMNQWYQSDVLRSSLLVSYCSPQGPYHSIEDTFDAFEPPFRMKEDNIKKELKSLLEEIRKETSSSSSSSSS